MEIFQRGKVLDISLFFLISGEFNVISTSELPPDGIRILTFLIRAEVDGRGTIGSVRADRARMRINGYSGIYRL